MELKTDSFKQQLSSLGDKVLKTPQQVKQRLYTGPRTKDVTVEELKNRFEVVHGCGIQLLHGCNQFSRNIQSLLVHFQRTIEIFNAIYDIKNDPDKSHRDFESLQKRFEIIKNKIEGDLPFFDQNVVLPIQNFHATCGNIQNTIDKRDLASYKADSLKHKLASISPQKLRTPGLKYENEKIKAESKYEKALKEYEPLNDQIRSELGIFLQMANSFFHDWFLNHYYITYSMYYNMYTFIGTCAEVRRIVIDSQNGIGTQDEFSPNSQQMISMIDIANNNLTTQFHNDFDVIAQEIKKLGISDFESFYARSTANANARRLLEGTNAEYSPIHHSSDIDSTRAYRHDQDFGLQYCKATTDFVPSPEDAENTLALRKDDVVKVYRKETEDWWYGQSLRTNKIGYFPLHCTTMANGLR